MTRNPDRAARAAMAVCLLLSGIMPVAHPDWKEREFNAIDGVARELMVAVGNRGTIVHISPGESGLYVPSHTKRNLLDVYVGSSDFAVAVGPGVLLRWDGLDWAPIDVAPDLEHGAMVWATPDQGLILYGGGTAHGYSACPWIPGTAMQPFCRTFDAPIRAACGRRDQLLLVLANGDIHRVNNTLIGSDGDFLPAYHPARPLQLGAAWLPAADCDPDGGLPEVFAIGSEGSFVHFDGQAWRPLDELPDRFVAGRALTERQVSLSVPFGIMGE